MNYAWNLSTGALSSIKTTGVSLATAVIETGVSITATGVSIATSPFATREDKRTPALVKLCRDNGLSDDGNSKILGQKLIAAFGWDSDYLESQVLKVMCEIDAQKEAAERYRAGEGPAGAGRDIAEINEEQALFQEYATKFKQAGLLDDQGVHAVIRHARQHCQGTFPYLRNLRQALDLEFGLCLEQLRRTQSNGPDSPAVKGKAESLNFKHRD